MQGADTPITETPIDGRRARRERGRIAVIDAMFDLLQEGKVPPGADAIAERSGVSVASIFRYFDGIDDLQLQTLERFRSRFEPLISASIEGDLRARIAGLVGARLDLYEQAGAIMAVGRLRGSNTSRSSKLQPGPAGRSPTRCERPSLSRPLAGRLPEWPTSSPSSTR